MEDGTCLIAVLLTSSTFSRFKFPRSSGILSSFKQPDRVSFWREVKLQTTLGRVERLLQYARSSIVRKFFYVSTIQFKFPQTFHVSYNFWKLLKLETTKKNQVLKIWRFSEVWSLDQVSRVTKVNDF
jgi:hypothetical protein